MARYLREMENEMDLYMDKTIFTDVVKAKISIGENYVKANFCLLGLVKML
jgi:hypothetical protein